jgi:uncharacterized membrane protein YfcA
MPDPLIIVLVFFFAVFTQTVAGFGVALVSTALLAGFSDLRVLVPLVALVAFTIELFILFRNRHGVNLSAIARLWVASAVAIPIGVFLLRYADTTFMLHLLGVVLVGYAVYALLNLHLPSLNNPRWALGFGFASGLLSGMYNASGPALVIYGTCRRWSPLEFRGNIQSVFILNSLIVVVAHLLSHNLTPVVFETYAVALPGVALGLGAGFALDRYINPTLFRRIVYVLLIALGLRLLLG